MSELLFSEPGLIELLRADLHRHDELLSKGPRQGLRLWLGMLSPRFMPVLLYRLAYASQAAHLGLLARMISLLNFMIFGLEIATICRIGPGLFLPHTQGTVIGAASIGANAIIYQGVTLGARDLDFSYDIAHRPTLGDDVMVGAGGKVLGGVRVGHRVRVAANAVLLTDAPDNSIAAGVPARIIAQRGEEG